MTKRFRPGFLSILEEKIMRCRDRDHPQVYVKAIVEESKIKTCFCRKKTTVEPIAEEVPQW